MTKKEKQIIIDRVKMVYGIWSKHREQIEVAKSLGNTEDVKMWRQFANEYHNEYLGLAILAEDLGIELNGVCI